MASILVRIRLCSFSLECATAHLVGQPYPTQRSLVKMYGQLGGARVRTRRRRTRIRARVSVGLFPVGARTVIRRQHIGDRAEGGACSCRRGSRWLRAGGGRRGECARRRRRRARAREQEREHEAEEQEHGARAQPDIQRARANAPRRALLGAQEVQRALLERSTLQIHDKTRASTLNLNSNSKDINRAKIQQIQSLIRAGLLFSVAFDDHWDTRMSPLLDAYTS